MVNFNHSSGHNPTFRSDITASCNDPTCKDLLDHRIIKAAIASGLTGFVMVLLGGGGGLAQSMYSRRSFSHFISVTGIRSPSTETKPYVVMVTIVVTMFSARYYAGALCSTSE